MTLHARLYLKGHFIAAIVTFAVLAFPSHSHGYWQQLRLIVFAPVSFVDYTFLPDKVFQQNSPLSYPAMMLEDLVAFLYVWLLVYAGSKVFALLARRSSSSGPTLTRTSDAE